ncbi:MAG: glycosyltransferase family 4 protein [Lachnospiraceae bacterium]|jgi:glycosyltransferase involved in cell wall biosynthesis|nr:glycosyltransferase family 4 protein [Lachnospiraceae bacterium]
MQKIILYLTARPNYGGAYQYWLAMLKALSQLNQAQYQLKVYSSHAGWRPIVQSLDLECTIVEDHLSHVQKKFWGTLCRLLPATLFYKITRIGHPLIRQIDTGDLDRTNLFIAQTSEIGGRLLGMSTVVPIFDLMHRFYPTLPEIVGEYKKREKLYRRECRYATMILVDSPIGQEHAVQFYGTQCDRLMDKIKILPFIPPDYIYNGEETIVAKERIFEKYLFYPAQFWAHKNHERLIRSVLLLKNEGIYVNLVLSGSEQVNRSEIMELITELKLDKQIKVLGYVSNEEMVYLYKNARALVMPTLFGPTNIPPLEAFELGCPVAISRLFGMPEQVGDAALLFDPLSESEIAECLKVLWLDDNLCEQLVARGRIRARQWGQQQFTETVLKYIEETTTDFTCGKTADRDNDGSF